jgi:hypothetical protein
MWSDTETENMGLAPGRDAAHRPVREDALDLAA